MLTTPAREYLIAAFDNNGGTLAALLSHFPANDTIWNTRPMPDRFSLREIVAHLADWEEVWQERTGRIVEEDKPQLLRPQIDQRALEKGYERADPWECLSRFREQRPTLTAWLRRLPDTAWQRAGHLERMGELTLEELLPLALGHDAYHLRQVAEWLASARTRSD